MDKYKSNLNHPDFLKFSGYVEDLIAKTQHFCSHVRENHQKHLKNQKKLNIYEKFQGLDKLSSVDLERLEKHLSKGVDLVKNERIRRKYEKQIALLQSKIMHSSKENETISLKNENIKKTADPFKELYEDLQQFLDKFPYFKAEIDSLKDLKENTNKKTQKISTTVKKTRHFSLGLLNFEESIEKDEPNHHENNHNNENLATKGSSFGEEELNIINNIAENQGNSGKNSNKMNKINGNTEEIFLINEILSSQQLKNREITKKLSNLTAEINLNEEHSPDFSFKSYIYPSNLNKTMDKSNGNLNLSFDPSTNFKNLKRKAVKNTSISGVAFAESIDFSFHEGDPAESQENQERMLKSANDVSEFALRENQYLKKLRKQMSRK